MWFKKNAYISGYNSNTAVDGTDWRTNGNSNGWPASQTLPSAADAGNYFYLPALGFYSSGQLSVVGAQGYYWTSSALPTSNSSTYNLRFGASGVNLTNSSRKLGSRVEPTFE